MSIKTNLAASRNGHFKKKTGQSKVSMSGLPMSARLKITGHLIKTKHSCLDTHP